MLPLIILTMMYSFFVRFSVSANQDNGSDIHIEHCVSSKFHTYPSPYTTLTLSKHFAENVGLRKGGLGGGVSKEHDEILRLNRRVVRNWEEQRDLSRSFC